MDKKIKISFRAIRNSAIALNIIALGIFLLLAYLYNLGSPFEIFGDFLVSVKFLPKWLSASVLLLGVIVRIADFIVITFLLPSPENKRSYSKKNESGKLCRTYNSSRLVLGACIQRI